MAILGNLVVNVLGDTTNLNNSLKSAQKNLQKFSTSMNKISQKAVDAGKTLTTRLTLPIVGLGVASVKMASDMDETMNKIDVVFEENAAAVKKWSETSIQKMGLASQTALDSAALFGDMGTGMGLVTSEASDMAMKLTQLSADLASFKNVRQDIASTALKGVYTGETESLKNLGIVMTQANLEEYALSRGINKRIKDMTQAEKVQLRYNYVIDQTVKAQGDFERTSDGAANQTRMLSESLKEIGAQLGAVILPTVNEFLKRINELLVKFQGLDEQQKQMIVKIAAVAAAVGPALIILGKLGTAIAGIAKVGSLLIGAFSGIGASAGAAAAAVGTGAGATAGGGLVASIGALVAPVAVVVAAIGGLTAAFLHFYNTDSEFRAIVIEGWTALKELFNTITIAIKGIILAFTDHTKLLWEKFGEDIKSIARSFLNVLKGLFEGIFKIITGLAEAFTALIKGDFDGFIDGITKALKAFIDMVINAVTGFYELIQKITGLFKEAIFTIIGKLKDGIKEIFEKIVTVIIEKVTQLKKDVVEKFETIKKDVITKLSTLAAEAGTWASNMMENFTNGIKEKIDAVKNAVLNIAKAIRNFLGLGDGEGAVEGPLRDVSEWGSNLIDMVVSGIRKGVNKVRDAAKEVAKGISDFLGFHSPTFEGPGSDADKWAPNFINMFVGGIKAGGQAMRDAAVGLMSKMKDGIESQEQSVASAARKVTSSATRAAQAQARFFNKDMQAITNDLGERLTDAHKRMYDEQEREQETSYRNQITEAKTRYNKELALIKRVRDEQLRNLDLMTNGRISEIEKQIDAIDKQTEAEDDALRERDFQERKAALEKEMLSAKDAEDLAEIQKRLNELIENRQRELLLKQREMQKEALRVQIENIRAEADAERAKIEQNYQANVEQQQRLLESQEQYYMSAIEKNSQHFDMMRANAEQAAIDMITKTDGTSAEMIAILDKYEPQWKEKGLSFADKLIEGVKEKQGEFDEVLNGIMQKFLDVQSKIKTSAASAAQSVSNVIVPPIDMGEYQKKQIQENIESLKSKGFGNQTIIDTINAYGANPSDYGYGTSARKQQNISQDPTSNGISARRDQNVPVEVNIYSPRPLSESEAARQFKRVSRELALEGGL